MMKRFLVLGCALVLFGVTSCSLDDDGPNFHFTSLEITGADLPEFFELNQTYRIDITYLRPDNCTTYEGLDIAKGDTTLRSVVAIGAVRTDLDDCLEEVTEGQAFFNFSVIYDEPYVFRFYQGDDADGEPLYFETTVPVN